MEAAPADLSALSTGELTSYIVWNHHRFLRESLPPVQRMSSKLARLHGVRQPLLRMLNRSVDTLAGLLMSHILVEERFLFPAMASNPPDRSRIRAEVFDAEDEHGLVAQLLDDIHALLSREDVAAVSFALTRRLQDLDADTRRHLALEREVLLPRFRAA